MSTTHAGSSQEDGMHRVAKAALRGREGVQFDADPEPDDVGLGPDELPY